MAGLEQVEIHSKSYLVRWIDVPAGHAISWSLQPHKKSINFGIFKHPGAASGAGSAAGGGALAGAGLGNGRGTPADEQPAKSRHRSSSSASALLGGIGHGHGHGSISGPATPGLGSGQQLAPAASVAEKLSSIGIKSVAWTGKCEADIVSTGRYDVPDGEAGMYGMVFDNTHSKQLSKMVTFVVMTFPSSSPPKSGSQVHYRQAMARSSSISLGGASPNLQPASDDAGTPGDDEPRLMLPEAQAKGEAGNTVADANGNLMLYTGVLSKKRRKRGQGWARRFFSLDFTSSTLSYYKNSNSSALRGSVPLSLAVVAADDKGRFISVDSGAEIWILRAGNQKDFDGWRSALEQAARRSSAGLPGRDQAAAPLGDSAEAEARAWDHVESLVGQVAGITDSMRRLAKDTQALSAQRSPSVASSPGEVEHGDYFDGAAQTKSLSPERSHFWRRKASTNGASSPGVHGNLFRRSSQQKTPTSASLAPYGAKPVRSEPDPIHERCTAVLHDLDAVVGEFSRLIADNRRRRQAQQPAAKVDLPTRPPTTSRHSIESTNEEFFDATDDLAAPKLVRLYGESKPRQADDDAESEPAESDADDDSESESDLDDDTPRRDRSQTGLFPPKAKSLAPLPGAAIVRRTTIPPAVGSPPSLISFLRKNVGKDLSTIAMPVTANEPLSLLQRQAELLEYSELLDAAAAAPPAERLLYVAAFALSSLSSSRLKERAARKPFNPMLGETYELVREDKGFRFVAEKVSHRPVRVASQAEAEHWTLTQAPSVTQKFWGKSAEINTNGKCRLVLHDPAGASRYSWLPATCFLRNIIAGDKYVEPVATMTVLEESSGRKAVVTFKAGGMFSGRSEEVTVDVYGSDGAQVDGVGLAGRWTQALTDVASNRQIWKAGGLVPDAAKRYGLTAYAAQLNELTAAESLAVLPPTDSRRRPDQRAYEQGKVDSAEELKVKLEEAQRQRRARMEKAGETWAAQWFGVVGADGDEQVWALREGEGAYWTTRAAAVAAPASEGAGPDGPAAQPWADAGAVDVFAL